MNSWSKQTLDIVKTRDYLDGLSQIYPQADALREVDEEALERVRVFFESRDCGGLLNQLLDLEKFPYKDSYVAFLRSDRSAIDRNPETVTRICRTLFDMGLDRVIQGASSPKESNQRRGNQFSYWVRRNFRFVEVDEFVSSKNGIIMLEASEKIAKEFCNRTLGLGIAKRPDMVAKAGERYVVGESKFLSSAGGNQGRAFDDGMNLATNTHGHGYKVFVLDGIHWIEPGSDQFKRIDNSNAQVFSSLLLKEYLEKVSQGEV